MYLFLVYLSISTCFGRLYAHQQEKQLCLCDIWYLLFCVGDCLICRSICSCIPDRITSTKSRINTVISPDDGHIVARNMYRLINILRINCTPSWFYLQDYAGMHGHQNIKFYNIKSILHKQVARSCYIQNTFQKSKTHSNAQYNTKHYFNYITRQIKCMRQRLYVSQMLS